MKAKHKTARYGHVRRIVLSPAAVAIVERRAQAVGTGRLFTLSINRFKHFWRKATKEAGVHDFRFHDVRHEGISRMAECDLTIGQLSAQSGHRSAQMLMRYVNARDKDILERLS